MAYPKITIHPCIRRVDNRPSRASQLDSGEVQGGDVVCVVLKTAIGASEERLSSSVASIYSFTSWASYRGVFRVDVNDWYSPLKSLIFDEKLQLSESPAVEVPVLAFPMLSSISNASQFLHNDYVALLKGVHELPADSMQNSINPSSLFR